MRMLGMLAVKREGNGREVQQWEVFICLGIVGGQARSKRRCHSGHEGMWLVRAVPGEIEAAVGSHQCASASESGREGQPPPCPAFFPVSLLLCWQLASFALPNKQSRKSSKQRVMGRFIVSGR